jgi:hypothetical protein
MFHYIDTVNNYRSYTGGLFRTSFLIIAFLATLLWGGSHRILVAGVRIHYKSTIAVTQTELITKQLKLLLMLTK